MHSTELTHLVTINISADGDRTVKLYISQLQFMKKSFRITGDRMNTACILLIVHVIGSHSLKR